MRAPLVARTARVAALLAGALAASGCNLGGGTEGELGRGRFFYECAAADDPFCSGLDRRPGFSEPPPVPTSVVVGSTFGLDFDLETTGDDTSLGVRVECALDGCDEGRHFRATREGWLGFVAVRSDGSAADVLHVLVTRPATIDFTGDRVGFSGSVHLFDVPTDVWAMPLGANGERLVGGFEATWESSDEAVVIVQSGGAPVAPNGPRATLVPVAPGEATVTVTIQGVQQQLPVSVQDEVLP